MLHLGRSRQRFRSRNGCRAGGTDEFSGLMRLFSPSHESATIHAGDRDAPFFAGWPRGEVSGNVTTRLAAGQRATLHVPLPVNGTYEAFVRLDPSLGPVAADADVGPVRILMNGYFIASCQPGGTPGAHRSVPVHDSIHGCQNRHEPADVRPRARRRIPPLVPRLQVVP
jgi:hypothetical protein